MIWFVRLRMSITEEKQEFLRKYPGVRMECQQCGETFDSYFYCFSVYCPSCEGDTLEMRREPFEVPPLYVGDEVRVWGGSFDGETATVQYVDEEADWVAVQLQDAASDQVVRVHRGQVQAVSTEVDSTAQEYQIVQCLREIEGERYVVPVGRKP